MFQVVSMDGQAALTERAVLMLGFWMVLLQPKIPKCGPIHSLLQFHA